MTLRWPALHQKPRPFTVCQRVKLVLIRGRLDQGMLFAHWGTACGLQNWTFTDAVPTNPAQQFCRISLENMVKKQERFPSINTTNSWHGSHKIYSHVLPLGLQEQHSQALMSKLHWRVPTYRLPDEWHLLLKPSPASWKLSLCLQLHSITFPLEPEITTL